MSACGLPSHSPGCRCAGSVDELEGLELAQWLLEELDGAYDVDPQWVRAMRRIVEVLEEHDGE